MEALLRLKNRMTDMQVSMTTQLDNLMEKVGKQDERLDSLESRMEILGIEEEEGPGSKQETGVLGQGEETTRARRPS